jgi:hypothetical protein
VCHSHIHIHISVGPSPKFAAALTNLLCNPQGTTSWADLGYHVHASADGHVAAQGNHSPADAMTALYMLRWIQNANETGRIHPPTVPAADALGEASVLPFKLLEWRLDVAQKQNVRAAEVWCIATAPPPLAPPPLAPPLAPPALRQQHCASSSISRPPPPPPAGLRTGPRRLDRWYRVRLQPL